MPARCILGALVSLGVAPYVARGAEEDPYLTLDDLAPPGPHRVQVTPELVGEDVPAMYAPDLTELILLAGHADSDGGLGQSTLDFLSQEAGWVSGVHVTRTESSARCYYDHVWSWRKGTHCIAAWSATDDMQDLILQGSGVDPVEMKPNTTRYCGFDINAFVVQEMEGFRRSPLWDEFLAYFSQEQCETVASIGHSLGGAMATAFAGCSNVGAEGFAQRSDFGLTVFGTFPASKEPIYSGTPGTPFVGTRYHISYLTGDPAVAEAAPKSAKLYRLDLLNLCHELATLIGLDNAARLIDTQILVIEQLFDSQVESYWYTTGVDDQLLPFMSIFKMFGAGVIPYGLPEAITQDMLWEGRKMYTTFLRKIIARGDAFFDFDPIGQHNGIYGYKHALLDFQPITNKMYGTVPLERIPAPRSLQYPVIDNFRALFGLQATGKLPNHYNCCYYRGKNCPYLYAKSATPFKACATTLPR